ncbi:hypothetical protein, partial [Shigella sonnei]|uniref:hypothetical protein n=1 Tax=Shigella sonnei TaxID=624 RepID=UPI003C708A94
VLVLYAYQSQCCCSLAANEAPLLIKFTDKGNISVSDWRRCYPPGRELFNVRMTVLMPIFSVLAV